jgi:hypothetical protein
MGFGQGKAVRRKGRVVVISNRVRIAVGMGHGYGKYEYARHYETGQELLVYAGVVKLSATGVDEWFTMYVVAWQARATKKWFDEKSLISYRTLMQTSGKAHL